jgi:6-phosphogluconolactonase/glucosamine-6-phosphate isomerase/deaminase
MSRAKLFIVSFDHQNPEMIIRVFLDKGENGHLAFNDPPGDFTATQPYLIVNLDEACRKQQVGEGWFKDLSEVPTQAISMSVRQILSSKEIISAVPDARKAEAVRRCFEENISPMAPASILRKHPSATICLDSESARLLNAATFLTSAAPALSKDQTLHAIPFSDGERTRAHIS